MSFNVNAFGSVLKCVLTPPRFFLSSSEWDQVDPSEREELNCQKEDGEFW